MLALALALLAPDVHAHPGHPPRRPPPPPPRAEVRVPPPADHGFSVVVNVVDVATPVISAGVEAAVGRRLSLGSTLGLGVLDTGADTVGLYDLSVDGRGYLLGDFDRGVFVGVGGGVTNVTPVSYGVETPTVQAVAGAKFTLPIGATIEAALGAEAHLDLLREAAIVAPTGRIGVGWSF